MFVDFVLLALLSAPFIGSFAATVVERRLVGQSIVFERSCCPHCGAKLALRELVPLISYVSLGGRCRACRAVIPCDGIAAEIGFLVVAVWAVFVTPSVMFAPTVLLGWTLILLAHFDLRAFVLPNALTLGLGIGGLVTMLLNRSELVLPHLLGAIAGAGFVWSIGRLYQWYRRQQGLGFGDVKLIGAAGLWVSWDGLVNVLLCGSMTALAFGIFGAWRDGTSWRTRRVPFGAFLCLGLWLVWLSGPLVLGT